MTVTRPRPVPVALALLLGALWAPAVPAQTVFISPIPTTRTHRTAVAQVDDAQARQVTLFGVIATPGGPIDPRLSQVEGQLRKLLPGHGFRLLGVQSKRLVAGETLECDLGDGFTASTQLLQPLDANGKVRLRCAVSQANVPQLQADVSTPPNQLFFCERALGGGTRLLIGVGAR